MNTRTKRRRGHLSSIEPLETRLLMFNTGGKWNNATDLAFSYANVFNGTIHDSAGNPLSTNEIRSAILEGMSVWTGVVPVEIHQEADFGPNVADLAYFDFDRLCRFGTHNIDGTPASNDIIGHAWGPDDLSSLAGDVHIDSADAFDTVAGGGNADLIELVTHEFGHALGMKHETSVTAIMNPVQGGYFRGPGTAFLFQDDINGIQSLYGKGLGYVLTDAERLIVSGTGSSDTLTVDFDSGTNELVVTSAGIGSFRIDENQLSTIEVDGRGGNDTIKIENLPGGTECVVNAGLGNDTINVGADDFNSNILSNVTVNGDGGTDTLFVRDGADNAGNDEYDITPTTLSKPGSNLLSWAMGDMENVTVVGSGNDDTFYLNDFTGADGSLNMQLQGSDGGDTFHVDELDTQIDLSILGGAANDVVKIGNGDFDQFADGSLDVDGGDGNDSLIVDDKNDAGADEYNIDFGSFSKSTGTGSVTFQSLSTLEVDGSDANNTFNVLGVDMLMTTELKGRGGDDTFKVSDYDYDSDIIGTLSIDGGGGAADFVDIRDSADGGNDSYTLTDETSSTLGSTFFKNTGGTTIFTAVEQLHLQANNDDNTITVGGNELGTHVTVYGLGGDDDITVGTGDLDLFDDEMVVWAGAGQDTVRFDDADDAPAGALQLPDTYRVTDSSVVKVQLLPLFETPLDYFEAEDVIVDGNADNNTFNVQSTGAAITLNGNGGNDRYNLGLDDNVKGLDGSVQADGGSGTDSLYYNDSAATQDRTYTVSPNNLSRTNVAVTRPLVEAIVVNAGMGNDTIAVTANVPTTVNGGGGDDTITAAGGTWDFGVLGALAIDGGAGTDSLTIDDAADTGPDSYTVTASQSNKGTLFSAPISYTTIEAYRLEANADADTINVNGTIAGDVRIKGNDGADTINVNNADAGTFVRVDGGAGLDNVSVNGDAAGVASVQFANGQDLSQLAVGAGGTLRLNAGRLLLDVVVASINGQLDLTDGGMIDRGGAPLAAYRADLKAGYNGGAWNGAAPSIVSTTAAASATNDGIGLATAGAAGATSFFGVAVNANDLLLRYTLSADANLDGKVDLTDFTFLAANFNGTGKTWVQGDFNYDDKVDLTDFTLLAANFNQNLP